MGEGKPKKKNKKKRGEERWMGELKENINKKKPTS